MSVRKRTWFTSIQIRTKAEELATEAGQADWHQYKASANAALAEALRVSQDKKADKREAAAAALTLKKYPPQEAWVVDYATNGGRHIKTFAKKKEADEFAATAKVEVRHGIHTPSSKSITVAEAGKLWLASAERNKLERTTIDGYKQHLALHIEPFLGSTKLSDLSTPMVREFEDKLAADKTTPRSTALIKKVRGSLGAILADAQERGLVARNVVRELRSGRRRGKERRADRRQKGKLKVGVDIPSPTEIKAIIEATEGRWRPFFLTAIFTGLRASELRGLRWADVDLKKAELHVTQRADAYREIGAPKSEAGHRTVPLTPKLLRALTEWKLACPKDDKGDLGLVFPNTEGKVEWHANIINRAWMPLQIAAGVTVQVRDDDGKLVRDEKGKPVLQAKYTGLHALRHFYASWCINRESDGGLELPAKVVQERLGHSSITVTLDTYGHLFPRGDDSEKLAEAENRLWA
ncbi:MAG TPA: site-specific integrase [Bradyrhizobium sp.]|uniref:site-specific integrase n=1 Tax=Bradyrhizobium sp. TaxID=376 RepID=UPI002C01F6E4|nr:site-specific integrase [Bradyrhizobium sp.]HLZ03422.1 site-specific integrase [Bradyrhizobium sp.]